MPILTVNSSADGRMLEIDPTTNYGTDTYMVVRNNSSNTYRCLLRFDFSSLPPNVPINAATLSLYRDGGTAAASERTYWAYRLQQTAWVENQFTWNVYNTGNSWSAGGAEGDYTTVGGSNQPNPANLNWINWDVKAQVEYALVNTSKISNFLIRDGAESGTSKSCSFNTREHTDASLRPKLVIDWISGPPIDYEWTKYSEQPTVISWDVTPQFKTVTSEFGTGKRVRNSKWSNPRYDFTIKYRTPMRDSDIQSILDFYIARSGSFEKFDMWVSPLGATHSVIFADDDLGFPYFASVVAELGEVRFHQVTNE